MAATTLYRNHCFFPSSNRNHSPVWNVRLFVKGRSQAA